MAYGDLGAVVDTLVYTSEQASCNEITHVVDDIYAVAWHHGTDINRITTFSIDDQGNISDSIIDELNFSPSCQTPVLQIAKVTDSLVAIASQDTLSYGVLDTVAINNQGIITDPKIDRWIWKPTVTYPMKLRHLGGGNLACFFHDGTPNGHVWTLHVSLAGIITEDVTDSLTFEPGSCGQPFGANVHPGIWAVTYRGLPDHAWIKTMSISGAGIIGDTVIDGLEFDPTAHLQTTNVHVRENFQAVAHNPTDGKGILDIIEISGGGAITDPAVDTYIFDAGPTQNILVYSIGQGYIGVAYRGAAAEGCLKTFYVDEDGSLNATTLDTLIFDPGAASGPHVVHVTGDVWAVAYARADLYGTVKTFGLDTPPEPVGGKDLMRGMYR